MALQIFSSNSIGAGVRVDLGTLDDVYIASNATVASTDNNAITGTGSNHRVTVEGSVFAASGTILLGNSNSADFNQSLYIGERGSVGSNIFGVLMQGVSSRITNHGAISGGSFGIIMDAVSAGKSVILNHGTISGNSSAITRNQTSDTETLVIRNFGTITSASNAFASATATAIDQIINRGLIVGDIRLDGGNDIYDGRGGTVEGTILGGDGNDTFRVGFGEEVIDGGAGVDLLDFRTGGAIRVSLDGSGENTGVADGDTYTNIENMFGSRLGNDALTGSNAGNNIRGLAGNDTISGLGGNDVIYGGKGADLLSGGAGNDRFVFESRTDGADRISDFGSAAGNDDSIYIKRAGFGAGLVNGVLAASQFVSRADNQAQDSNDRFIFRTTDKTLWFDTNGSGAGGLSLVADLQDNATLSATDIIIF